VLKSGGQGSGSIAERTDRDPAIAAAWRLPYSRSSFESVGHEVGKLFAGKRADIEEVLIRAYELPEAAVSVSVSLDRVSLPMEEPKPRPPDETEAVPREFT
jgi:hypothetical protein